MDACIFRTRFKELRKESGMKYEDVAAKAGIGLETVRSHCRSKASMPQLDYLEAYSKLFDVDIAYLLGEQDCRRHTDQSICDVTHLTEDAAGVLCDLNKLQSENLSKIITHHDFKNLLDNISRYMLYIPQDKYEMYSSLDDALLRNEGEPLYLSNYEKLLVKSIVKTEFEEIISDAYNTRTEKEKNIYHVNSVVLYYYLIKEYLEDCQGVISKGMAEALLYRLFEYCKLLEYSVPSLTIDTIQKSPPSLDLFIDNFKKDFADYLRIMEPPKPVCESPIIRPYKEGNCSDPKDKEFSFNSSKILKAIDTINN